MTTLVSSLWVAALITTPAFRGKIGAVLPRHKLVIAVGRPVSYNLLVNGCGSAVIYAGEPGSWCAAAAAHTTPLKDLWRP